MANLLVMYDNTNLNQSYPKFDIVAVREDGVPFGSGEGYPGFLKVHLQGVTSADASFLTDVEWDDTVPFGVGLREIDVTNDVGVAKSNVILYKRAYKIAESRLNPPTLAAIDAAYQANEILEVADAAGMLNWLEKKLDGSQPPAWGNQ